MENQPRGKDNKRFWSHGSEAQSGVWHLLLCGCNWSDCVSVWPESNMAFLISGWADWGKENKPIVPKESRFQCHLMGLNNWNNVGHNIFLATNYRCEKNKFKQEMMQYKCSLFKKGLLFCQALLYVFTYQMTELHNQEEGNALTTLPQTLKDVGMLKAPEGRRTTLD